MKEVNLDIIDKTKEGLGDHDATEVYAEVKQMLRDKPMLLNEKRFSEWLKVHQVGIRKWLKGRHHG